MTPEIKECIEIDKWLLGLDIRVEVAENMPVIVHEVYDMETKRHRYSIQLHESGKHYFSPYYKCASNSLKALRGLELKDPKNRLLGSNECEEEGCPCWDDPRYPSYGDGKKHKLPAWKFFVNPSLDKEKHPFGYFWCWGKTDDEALFNLLKTLEEKNNG